MTHVVPDASAHSARRPPPRRQYVVQVCPASQSSAVFGWESAERYIEVVDPLAGAAVGNRLVRDGD